jgi:hypothetical protein
MISRTLAVSFAWITFSLFSTEVRAENFCGKLITAVDTCLSLHGTQDPVTCDQTGFCLPSGSCQKTANATALHQIEVDGNYGQEKHRFVPLNPGDPGAKLHTKHQKDCVVTFFCNPTCEQINGALKCVKGAEASKLTQTYYEATNDNCPVNDM